MASVLLTARPNTPGALCSRTPRPAGIRVDSRPFAVAHSRLRRPAVPRHLGDAAVRPATMAGLPPRARAHLHASALHRVRDAGILARVPPPSCMVHRPALPAGKPGGNRRIGCPPGPTSALAAAADQEPGGNSRQQEQDAKRDRQRTKGRTGAWRRRHWGQGVGIAGSGGRSQRPRTGGAREQSSAGAFPHLTPPRLRPAVGCALRVRRQDRACRPSDGRCRDAGGTVRGLRGRTGGSGRGAARRRWPKAQRGAGVRPSPLTTPRQGPAYTNFSRRAAKQTMRSSSQPWRQRWMLVWP